MAFAMATEGPAYLQRPVTCEKKLQTMPLTPKSV